MVSSINELWMHARGYIYCAHDPPFPTLLSQSNEHLPAKFSDSLIRN